MDLIDRQAAIVAVRLGALSTATVFGRTDEGMTARKEIECAINNLPSAQPERKKGKWIPCRWHTEEENLPKERKSVLVCIKENCGYLIGVSYRADYNRWEGFGRANVVAWMPLPEPWRGEEP